MRRTRAVAAWLPALLLVAAGMTVAARVATPHDAEAATRQVYPLDSGTTWVYAVSDHGEPSGTHTRQVVSRGSFFDGDSLVEGAARVRDTYTSYPGIGPRETTSWFHAEGDRIVQYGVATGSHDYLELDPPANVYEVADAGTEFSYRGTYSDQDFRFTTEIAERGPVTVGGHTFSDCTRTVTTIPTIGEDPPATEETVEEWTCPGIGPVRSSDSYPPNGFESTEELIAFHGVSGSWYADGAPPGDATVTPQEASGPGLTEQRTNAVDGELGSDLAWTITRDTNITLTSASGGSLLVTGDTAGWVAATDVRSGAQTWQLRLPPPVLVAPTVSGDTVLVSGGDRRLWALSLADGSARWVHDFHDVVTATPSVSGSTVVVASDDGAVTALDLADGTELWSTTLGARVSAPTAVDGGQVFACDRGGNVTALDLSDGSKAWSRTVSEGALTGPAVVDGLVLTQGEDAVIYAFDGDDGRLAWETRSHGQADAAFAAAPGMVVTALNNRELTAFDLDDGSRLWRRAVPLSFVPPVIVGDQVVSVGKAGRLTRVDRRDGRVVDAFDLPAPVAGQEPYVDHAVGLVDGDLVIGSRGDGALAFATLYGYPVDGRAVDGVLLDVRPRRIPSPPTEPVTPLPDGDVLVPGYDQDLVRVDPDGRATTIAHNADRIAAGGVAAHGLVVTRVDNQLVAVPEDGGPPVWTLDAGDAYLGSVPVVDGDTVYAGSDGSLVAVGLAQGDPRWSVEVEQGVLPGRPLVLEGGDLVYGVGLARYRAASGETVWSHPDLVAVGRPIQVGDSVVAEVQGTDGTSGIGAWDATTGSQRWFVAGAPESYVGPAEGQGLVVWVDGAGVVRALDAGTGRTVWSLPLQGRAAGAPAVRDGRVLVAVAGLADDFEQRDFRVVALDLASGHFLASWEPESQLNWVVPSVTPGLGGGLLVPMSGDDFEIVEVTPHG